MPTDLITRPRNDRTVKLVRYYASDGTTRPGVLVDDQVLDLSPLVDDYTPGWVAAGGIDDLATTDLGGLHATPVESVRFSSPLSSTRKICCIGLNYRQHAMEAGQDLPTEPILFMKAANTLSGPNDEIAIPPGSKKTDWEVELAVVIGKQCRYLPNPEVALAHVAGYCVSNDVSERHWQLERGGQWVKGKSFESFNPLGPWLVTPDEVPNPQDLELWLSVNGEELQRSNTADMIFSIDYIIWYLSQFMVLEPGDLVNTGTPSGVGLGLIPPRYLADRDVVELGVTGLGTQRQECRQTKIPR